MKPSHMGWAVFGLLAVVILLVFAAQTMRSQAPSPQPQASASQDTSQGGKSSPSSTPTPSPTGSGQTIQEGNVNGHQAPTQPSPKKPTRQKITQPSPKKPDVQKAPSVAEALMSAYNSRTSEQDQGWKSATKAWMTPDLAANLAEFPNPALQGKGASAVTKVQIKGPVSQWGRDTPVRWAHVVDVTVKTEAGGSYVLTFNTRAQLTEKGWLFNAAELDTWHRAGK